jgi:uncharacterized paraquat-inducible protein A
MKLNICWVLYNDLNIKIPSIKTMDKTYYCPRCKTMKLIRFTDTAECPRCKLEFFIKDLDRFEPDQILSVQEKAEFINTFKDTS